MKICVIVRGAGRRREAGWAEVIILPWTKSNDVRSEDVDEVVYELDLDETAVQHLTPDYL